MPTCSTRHHPLALCQSKQTNESGPIHVGGRGRGGGEQGNLHVCMRCTCHEYTLSNVQLCFMHTVHVPNDRGEGRPGGGGGGGGRLYTEERYDVSLGGGEGDAA